MNLLTQDTVTSEQDVEKVNDLFAVLGDDYPLMLGTKYVMELQMI